MPRKGQQLDAVDSSQIEFLLTGERFPIGLVGSYNIDKAKAILATAPRTSKTIGVGVWRAFAKRRGWRQWNVGRTVDCSVPAIVATVSEARRHYLLIDGWHRIHQASSEGLDVIQAFYLTEAETARVFDISMLGFDAGCSFV